MRKVILIALSLVICIVSIGAERKEEIPYDNTIDFEEQGFEKMTATAYCMGHHTANGSSVHVGGCAVSSEHLGDIAIIYTIGGEFLGYYECNDTGGEPIESGYVIDLYRTNETQCKSLMKLIASDNYKVWVKYIKGVG